MLSFEKLTSGQRDVVGRWVPDARVVADHSWGLVDNVVLELDSAERGRLILKVDGPTNHHVTREIRAHREWVSALSSTGLAPVMVYADEASNVLITRYLPGELVQGTPAQDDPDTFRQAGSLLAIFHRQLRSYHPTWNDDLREQVKRHLAAPHRIDPSVATAVRTEISTWPTGGAEVVPTHGDWQPRNWLIDQGTVRIIDFGRADLRPADTDLARLARQDFQRNPELESAFFTGYGSDPREPEQWRRTLIAEAVGTASWAYGVNDYEFEAVGQRQLKLLYP